MTARRPLSLKTFAVAVLLAAGLRAGGAEPAAADLSGFREGGGITVRSEVDRLEVRWPMAGEDSARLVLDLRPGEPLIERLGIGDDVVVKAVDPATFVTVGTRVATPDRPPGMGPFNEFFDAPAKRPHASYRAKLEGKRARVTGRDGRATVILENLTAGPFAGSLQITVYAGTGLVHVEAVVSTKEEDRAFLYDAGLVAASPTWRRLAWVDANGEPRHEDADPFAADRPEAVRHRALAVESGGGALACFPPPHQFFTPRDLTDNLKNTWIGRGHRGLEDRSGFGIRQAEEGGGSFAPWFNAPPGTMQRLGVFYLLAKGTAEDALRDVRKFTRNDRFAELPGHLTLTSHWHMATAVAAMKERAAGGGRTVPDLVAMFKAMGVNIVHLAEFHGDGHPRDPGPLRLPELEAMFAECRRLSDSEILFLPGEEANVHLGPSKPGGNPGHWLYLFPKPVAWTMQRAKDQPFVEDDPRFGKLYHVGNRDDMARLLEVEHGLAWTAHPRIKASTWAPDIYRNEEFYRSETWLGAAWKAMPADLSSPRLGVRGLDLLDDMANWGGRKYLLGEVDVFKIDRTHELFGHMNINYVRLDKLPRFDDGWPSVLDALGNGRFFVTTGEVLLREFTVGGKASGETLPLDEGAKPEVRIDLEWTFPLRFAEVVSGDGERVIRDRIDLSDSKAFGRRTLTLPPDLKGRRWARVEVWDVAGNGAFSQPVWLVPKEAAQ